MHILLTGSSGFLGSALAHHLVKCGHELTLLARPTSTLDRLGGLMQSVRVLRPSSPDEIIVMVREAAPDAIIHTACAYGRKGETPLNVMDANLVLGITLLQVVLDGEARNDEPVTFLNTGTVLTPDVSLYALSKNQFSAWGAALAEQSPRQLRFIDIRLQQMYGPGDDRSKFTTHVIEVCRSNEPRLALTKGEQRRDFIHIDDVVRAYDLILERRGDFKASDVIDVGSGSAITMRDFVEITKQVTGASTVLDFGAVPYRAKEPMLCVADTTRLRGLGWEVQVSLADGLARITDSDVSSPLNDARSHNLRIS